MAAPLLASQVRVFAGEDQAVASHMLALDCARRWMVPLGYWQVSDEAALVIFACDSQLARDAHGRLVVTSRGGAVAYRVGDMAAGDGPNGTDDPDVRRLRESGGKGPIANVTDSQCLRLFGLPDRIAVEPCFATAGNAETTRTTRKHIVNRSCVIVGAHKLVETNDDRRFPEITATHAGSPRQRAQKVAAGYRRQGGSERLHARGDP